MIPSPFMQWLNIIDASVREPWTLVIAEYFGERSSLVTDAMFAWLLR
jgi:hypothetical protein